MLLTGLFLLIVEAVITFHIMKTIVMILAEMPDRWYKAVAIGLFINPIVAFMLNLLVSTLLSSFTGSGLISGIANLGSSVLVAIINPLVLRRYLPVNINHT